MLAVFLLLVIGSALAQDFSVAQQERSPDMRFNTNTPFTLPKEVFEFLEKYNWGDFHMVFHMSRHYYTIGQQGRQWLDRAGEPPGPFQEGDPNNGVEFLTMHRAMLEYLRQRFGRLPVKDFEGRATVADVLDGWKTDNDVIKALTAVGPQAVAKFKAGLVNINNFAQFKTEDEFGLFLQTGTRLQGTVNHNDPSVRNYVNDPRPGAGVHNWLHGQFMDDSSPITVGDPRTNLPNIMFWRIHGWIEGKWKAFEASRRRSAAEEQLYQGFITTFRAHMIRMSDKPASASAVPNAIGSSAAGRCALAVQKRVACSFSDRNSCVLGGCCWLQAAPGSRAPSCFKAAGGSVAATTAPIARPSRSLFALGDELHNDAEKLRRDARRVERSVDRVVRDGQNNRVLFRLQESLKMHRNRRNRVPWSLVLHIRPLFFRNHLKDCARLSRGTTSPECPQGPLSRGIPSENRPRGADKRRLQRQRDGRQNPRVRRQRN